ncbi:MAG TPA: hypothetical protein VMD77_02220 [Candidatus Baltobacteraceae bacterium]|nr:hypothetical protein [Verrucomicrobiae bacterium]HTX14082.1 hypothetical protein [Candidatus Baltobacteraceae bacterium]
MQKNQRIRKKAQVFEMRLLKIFLAFFCAWSAVDFIVAASAFHVPHGGAYSKPWVMAESLVSTLLLASALYGLRKRTLVVWRLGWCYLVAAYLSWLFTGLSSSRKIPPEDSPIVASAAIVIGGAIVAVYWGFWWNRQKNYFITAASVQGEQGGVRS